MQGPEVLRPETRGMQREILAEKNMKKSLKTFSYKAMSVIAGWFMLALSVLAQTPSNAGQITGVVKDPTQSVVPGHIVFAKPSAIVRVDRTDSTLLKDARNKQNAIKFLQLLLGPEGTTALKKNGPDPLSPAIVSSEDFRNLPEQLRPLVLELGK